MNLDVSQIQKIIPHRFPMLLVDQVIDLVPGKQANALKNISLSDNFVHSSSVTDPIFPRPLIIEALAQTGAVALLSQDDFKGKTAYFGGIKSAEFFEDVRPGDQLELKTELIKIKGPIGVGHGEAWLKQKKIAEAELTFMIN